MGTELMKLQNGSDVRGVACEGVPGEAVNLTEDIVCAIAAAFVRREAGARGKKAEEMTFAVGRDSRITGDALSKAFIRGVCSEGAKVLDCGMASTPAMFMSIVYPETAVDASCMLTASHLPFNRNGMKFFTREGGYDKADITALLKDAGESSCCEGGDCCDEDTGRVSSFDLIGLYADKLVGIIRKEADAADHEHPLKGLKVIVDAGNGAGGFFAEKVLKVLGADITGSQFLEPDGSFPNHAPNPEDKAAMRSVCEATVKSGADIGLIFDTDVDRMSAVLSDGTPVNRDSIIALMAAILAPDYPGSTIITDSVTSDRLTDFLEGELKLKHLCYMRGYKNVINKCRELNEAGEISPLAMETSGHGCLKENYYLDDGAYLAVKLMIALSKAHAKGQRIDDLIGGLSQEYRDREVRFAIRGEDFAAYGQEVLKRFKDAMEAAGYELPRSFEGVRVRLENGWLVLRASLHDPVMVLNMEGRDEAALNEITEIVRGALSGEEGLDISGL